jgi:fatty acid desaturase
MPLSEYEQSVIEQLERSLMNDDFEFGRRRRGTTSNSVLRVLAIIALLVFGMVVLAAGVTTQQIYVGVLGFVFVFMGIALASTAKKPKADYEISDSYLNMSPRDFHMSNTNRTTGSFMARLESRWDKRKEDTAGETIADAGSA